MVFQTPHSSFLQTISCPLDIVYHSEPCDVEQKHSWWQGVFMHMYACRSLSLKQLCITELSGFGLLRGAWCLSVTSTTTSRRWLHQDSSCNYRRGWNQMLVRVWNKFFFLLCSSVVFNRSSIQISDVHLHVYQLLYNLFLMSIPVCLPVIWCHSLANLVEENTTDVFAKCHACGRSLLYVLLCSSSICHTCTDTTIAIATARNSNFSEQQTLLCVHESHSLI